MSCLQAMLHKLEDIVVPCCHKQLIHMERMGAQCLAKHSVYKHSVCKHRTERPTLPPHTATAAARCPAAMHAALVAAMPSAAYQAKGYGLGISYALRNVLLHNNLFQRPEVARYDTGTSFSYQRPSYTVQNSRTRCTARY